MFIDMIYNIAKHLLNDLVKKGHISEKEKSQLLKEIKEKGVGFIPAYFNPVLYHKTINNQKALITAA
jgi:predicted transcriptional regulator